MSPKEKARREAARREASPPSQSLECSRRSPAWGRGGLGAAGLAREAQPRARPRPALAASRPNRRNPEMGEGSSAWRFQPWRRAINKTKLAAACGGTGRGVGGDAHAAEAWPCPQATDRPPQLLLSSPAGDQTADKAAVSFPVRREISSPALGRRALGAGVGDATRRCQ